MQEEKTDQSHIRGRGRLILLVLLILVVFCVVVMVINSRKPQYHALEGVDKRVKGAHFIKVNEMLIKDMADNWLPNDLFWPTVLLDNCPTSSWVSSRSSPTM